MIVSMFEVAGPIMVGPSSSHTAGAARLSRLATLFLSQPFTHVSFGLHGSFARTYHGHGTDLALVAGVLGIRQEDEEMKRSFQVAQERGITYDFYPTDLGDAHENSVVMDFTLQDGSHTQIVGSSVGGRPGAGHQLRRDRDRRDPGLSHPAGHLRGQARYAQPYLCRAGLRQHQHRRSPVRSEA
ncbi:MAG: hypothetical protein LIO51_01800 [Clostridiales bacterium]|nr:hypothetical protein [Clostridiales bacterium]